MTFGRPTDSGRTSPPKSQAMRLRSAEVGQGSIWERSSFGSRSAAQAPTYDPGGGGKEMESRRVAREGRAERILGMSDELPHFWLHVRSREVRERRESVSRFREGPGRSMLCDAVRVWREGTEESEEGSVRSQFREISRETREGRERVGSAARGERRE